MRLDTDSDVTTRRTFLRGTATAAGAAVAAGASAGAASAQDGPDYGGWFAKTSNFSGTYDFTGKSKVTIDVGAKGNNGNFAFGPAAVRVDPGTEVVWKWTGKGGSHNVVADDGSFKCDLKSEAGATFSHTFDEKGTYKYYCNPHKMLGMKGAVVVGGSGGKDPSALASGSAGAGESGGEGGSGEGGSSGGIGLQSASVIAGVVIAFVSPLVFSVLMGLKRSNEPVQSMDRTEP